MIPARQRRVSCCWLWVRTRRKKNGHSIRSCLSTVVVVLVSRITVWTLLLLTSMLLLYQQQQWGAVHAFPSEAHHHHHHHHRRLLLVDKYQQLSDHSQQRQQFYDNNNGHVNKKKNALLVSSISSISRRSSRSALTASSTAVSLSSSLSCTAAQVPRVALTVGGMALLLQWLLARIIRQSWHCPPGTQQQQQQQQQNVDDDETTSTSTTTTTSTASMLQQQKQQQKYNTAAHHLAHSGIALLWMITVSWIGVTGYCVRSVGSGGRWSAQTLLLEPDDRARWLAAAWTGLLLLWDVPTTTYLLWRDNTDFDTDKNDDSSSSSIILILHHLVMAAVAWMGATQLPMHLIYFYLGAAELSSIPLVVHDQLVRSWATDHHNNINTKNTLASRLAQWLIRTALPVVTALSFTAVRAVWFPYVTLRHFLPSVHHVLTTTTTASTTTTTVAVQNALRGAAVAAVGFMLLQWYWFVTQIVLVAIVPRQGNNHTHAA